jgi:ubiquinone/menaquinone biosynthesis C-methylase UbiE
MQFDDAIIGMLESIYQTKEAAARRQAVLAALALKRGECTLDIGTGPGFVALEMAMAVGITGQVECIDTSESMMSMAFKQCAGKPWTSFQIGNAAELPVSSNCCDAAAAIQVLEFVPNVSRALEELYRVLRPGGRAAIVSTDWPSLVWNASNMVRMAGVLDAFSEHCAHLALPRSLAPLARAAGFTVADRSILPHFDAICAPGSFSALTAELIASFVPGRRGVTGQDAAAWLADLRETAERGEAFFSLNQYLFLVEKPPLSA